MFKLRTIVNFAYLVCGFIIGICLEKSKLLDPGQLRLQFTLKRLLLLKMIFAATATAMLFFALLAMFPRTRHSFMQACNSFFGVLNSRGVLSSVLGGSLMGLGCVLSGSCPSTLFSQIGASVPNSPYVLIGGILGICLYLLMRPMFESLSRSSIKESTNPWDDSPFFILALPLVAMFGLLVVAFETLIPWKNELNLSVKNSNGWLSSNVWPPYMCGVIIATVHLPLVLLFRHTFDGGLHIFAGLSSYFCWPVFGKSSWQFGTASSRWQILLIFGLMSGAYYSASLSQSFHYGQIVTVRDALVGGCLMYFGAMIAGGCTTIHGFTGVALLSILSFITLISMFLSGILSGQLLQHWRIIKL